MKKVKLAELGSLFGGEIQVLEGTKIEGDVDMIDLGQMGLNKQMTTERCTVEITGDYK